MVALQRFLYTSQSLSDKEKGRLQKEILDTIFAESKLGSDENAYIHNAINGMRCL